MISPLTVLFLSQEPSRDCKLIQQQQPPQQVLGWLLTNSQKLTIVVLVLLPMRLRTNQNAIHRILVSSRKSFCLFASI